MPELQRLRADHAPALLAFERENRGYFARSVPDRGDAYFAEFAAWHAALLAEQAAGTCHFHLLVDGEGAVLGRVNLVDVADGEPELGYRVAERAAGRGLATDAVRRLCELAEADYGLTAMRAATYADNARSRAVLERTGFVVVGEVELPLEGRTEVRYFREVLPG
ncbi:GNAT family N-acetyltransferase [Streptomyces durmitorensis]|uniref:GNAT family N-acetyltransferase n=1 Tax=Streptomyces durmitorensis TaxID=319947 RepID=A0ABY4Q0C8_9ACTN|nr:GNAT family N-acetyltransferase [Streptomyces durmitorensis]UQT58641.1 GNAT family N-acetyltransferase [Streptomyces durmitorensis]